MNSRFPMLLVLSAALHALVLWAVASDRPAVVLLVPGEISVDCQPSPAADPRPLLAGKTKEVKKEPEKPKEARPSPPPQKKPKEEPRPPERKQPLPDPKQPTEKPSPQVERPTKRRTPETPPEKKPDRQPPDTKPAPARESAREPTASSQPQKASRPSSPKTQGVKTEARLLGQQKPRYPLEAQLRGQEGEVLLSLDLSAEGRVLKAKVVRSSGHRILDDSALHFAESLEFVPARQGGRPVSTTVEVPIRYRLVDPY